MVYNRCEAALGVIYDTKLDIPSVRTSSLAQNPSTCYYLTLSNSEHLGSAYGAHTLSCRLTILHGYGLGVFHFPFGAAFHAVSLH